MTVYVVRYWHGDAIFGVFDSLEAVDRYGGSNPEHYYVDSWGVRS